MALGTGSALAHRAVDSVLGSRHPEPAQAQACTARVEGSHLSVERQRAEHYASHLARVLHVKRCLGIARYLGLMQTDCMWSTVLRRRGAALWCGAALRCFMRVRGLGGWTCPHVLLGAGMDVTRGGWACAQEAAAQVAAMPNEPCANFAKTFTDCMSDSNGDLEACRCALCTAL